MAQIKLKKLLRQNSPVTVAFNELATNLAVTVQDDAGTVLLGFPQPEIEKTAVSLDGELIGWVMGKRPQAEIMARILSHLLEKEAEKRAVAAELLDKYRELNLLYTLSERLIAEPDPAVMAKTSLAEATRLIWATTGWVLLYDVSETGLQPIATTGTPLTFSHPPGSGDTLIARVLASREAEIRNEQPAARYFNDPPFEQCGLICAPLKTEQRLLGVFLLLNAEPASYTAHDLKLLNTMALQAAPILEMARLYQIALVQGRMERELQMAYEVQASLIPTTAPQIEGWEFAGRWQPARELSGDYYDFIPQADGRLGLVIGDVADKGMPSALFMVHTRSAVRTAVAHTQTPAAAIYQANQLVVQESTNGLFVTLMYGRLNTHTGELIYVNAGHNPALHYQAATGQLDELTRTGLPLGILEESPFEQQTCQVQPGDFVVFYTDGVTEAMNEVQEEFGLERIMAVLIAQAAASAEALALAVDTAVTQFVGSASPHDDFTLLVVKRPVSA